MMDTHAVRGSRWSAQLACCIVALAAAHAHAQAVFTVTEPWVRPAGAGQSTVAYMELMSSAGATLVEVRTPAASAVALQDAKRRTAPSMALTLPARQPVALAPDGHRLLLRALKQPLRPGDRVPLVLVVRAPDGVAQEINVDAEVRRRSPTDDHLRPHVHH
jgi:copper(I)-binding protein